MLIYSADDVKHAEWEVENWHTGALKWMVEGAAMLRSGKIEEAAWVKLGATFAKNAEVMLGKLRAGDAITRAKQFGSALPAAMKTTVKAAAGGLKEGINAVGAGLPWWLIGIGVVVAVVAVSGAVADTARAIRD